MFKFIKWSLAAMLVGAFAASTAVRADDFFRGFPDFDGRKIGHVWIIVLENESFNDTFGPNSLAPFLSKTLPSQGVMLNQYYGTGHVSLDNYVSMVSGQGPTVQTRVDCTFYDDFQLTGITPDGQAVGTGCVYPPQIKTIGDQLSAARLSWKGYMEDMGKNPTREQATCGQPLITINGVTKVALNQIDNTQAAEAFPGGDQYAARHNPFVYFHSLIDSGQCSQHVVNFNQLQQDLAHESTTPRFSFITPNLCHDGHDGNGTTSKCKNTVEPGGLVSIDAFLKQTVPMIQNSTAYKEDGLIIITFDEGGLTFDGANSQITAEGISCCGQQPGPNIAPLLVPGQPLKLGFENIPRGTPPNFFTTTTGFGGDRIGGILLSPFLKPGTVSNVPFNHYSMLKTVEDIFGLDYLGYAGQPGLQGFFGCTNSDIRVGGDDDQFRHCQRDRD
ncbi:MAG TPA: alkaline phosphatase family protein [Bradyrhizobium sp.]|uniref:alkaline phosphatase family protein n=1 Tax=Bradyrhizobium sp. TaxID=376 RepID=UPI002D7F18AF|nr:alkaline phosphatase family protein [Bradyrhizobium sp.]HET7889219.1 alkaline phosphatase family protein [Bradyrhizobium sp.]